MADLIRLNDGEMEIVSGLEDFMRLVDSRMGFEAARWLSDYLAGLDEDKEYCSELEREIDRLRSHEKSVMEKLREQSEILAGLIGERDIDRKALSAAAGKIGMITWEEANG